MAEDSAPPAAAPHGPDVEMEQPNRQPQKRHRDEVESPGGSGDDRQPAQDGMLPSTRKKPRLETSAPGGARGDVDEGASSVQAQRKDGRPGAAHVSSVEAAETPPESPASWNHGITSRIRTTLGSSLSSLFPRASRKPVAAAATEQPATDAPEASRESIDSSPKAQARAEEEAAEPSLEGDVSMQDGAPEQASQSGGEENSPSETQPPSNNAAPAQTKGGKKAAKAHQDEKFPIPPYTQGQISWSMPPSESRQHPKKFESWCRSFLSDNRELLHLATSQLVRDAYRHYLKELPDISAKLIKKATLRSIDCQKEGRIDVAINEVQSAVLPSEESAAMAAPRVFNQLGVNWRLPAVSGPPDLSGDQKPFDAWKSLFEGWGKGFLELNRPFLPKVTAQIVLDAFFYLVDNTGFVGKKTRKHAKSSSSESNAEGKVQALIDSARAGPQQPAVIDLTAAQEEVAGAGGQGTTRMETGDAEPGEVTEETTPPPGEDLAASSEELRRYFPGIAPDARFCFLCASPGHRAGACPAKTCKFCRGGHFAYSCPDRQRCQKCRQLGHGKAACREKLALAPGEGFVECAFCQSMEHAEEACSELWRSYRSDPEDIKKVKALPVYCYSCGAEGHYGGECGLAGARSTEPPSETWTKACRDRYLDPETAALAIALENLQPVPGAPGRPDIPGRSIVPRTHVFFEESDDDAEQFITAPVARPRAPGQIRIASNIDFTLPSRPPPPSTTSSSSQNDPNTMRLRNGTSISRTSGPPDRSRQQPSGGRGANGAPVNPPLPPGPPPATRPQHSSGFGAPNGGAPSRGGARGGRGGFSRLQQYQNPSQNQNNGGGGQQGKNQGPQSHRGSSGAYRSRGGARGRAKRGRTN